MNKKQIKLGILAMASVNMSGMIISPAIASIAQDFPEAGLFSIQLLLTLPALTAVLTSILCGYAAVTIPKKYLGILGMLLMCAGGVAVVFMDSIAAMLGASAVRGIGTGLLAPLGASLADYYFTGEERKQVLGQSGTATSAGGMLLVLAAGILTTYHWRSAFLLFLTILPALAAFVFLLPVDTPPGRGGSTGKASLSFSPRLGLIAVSCLVYLTLFHVFGTNIAVFIEEMRIGTAALAGWANFLFMGGGMLGGVLFSRVDAGLRRFTVSLAYAVCGAGLLLILTARLELFLLGCLLGGSGMTIMMVKSNLNAIGTALNRASVPLAVAAVSVSFSLAQFLSPLATDILSKQLADGSSYGKFGISGIALLALALAGAAGRLLRPEAGESEPLD